MDRRDAGGLQPVLEVQIEVGCIDADEQVGALLEQPGEEFAPDSHDLPVVPENLDVSAHGKLFHREQGLEALAGHPWPADAMESQAGAPVGEGADEVCAQQVPGGLPRHRGDSCFAHRTIPRVAEPRKSRNKATSGQA